MIMELKSTKSAARPGWKIAVGVLGASLAFSSFAVAGSGTPRAEYTVPELSVSTDSLFFARRNKAKSFLIENVGGSNTSLGGQAMLNGRAFRKGFRAVGSGGFAGLKGGGAGVPKKFKYVGDKARNAGAVQIRSNGGEAVVVLVADVG